MRLENLEIRRVCLHEVYKRNDERSIVAPTYGEDLLELNDRARDTFASRVVAAFRSDAKCLDMTISRHEAGSIAALGVELSGTRDEAFAEASRPFAGQLAAAQRSRGIPGGVVAVFDGTVGHPARRFFAVMKAELHDGFLKTQDLQAQLVDNLFLSPKTKMYKIGMFIAAQGAARALPDGWEAAVYDSALTAAQREGAALYFHEAYLGLDFPDDSAHQVKKFWNATREFIRSAPLDEEDKVDLYNSLYTYLKVDQSPTVQVSTFADTYVPEDLSDDYREHMRRERVPERAIPKDLAEIRGALRLRRFRFPNRITLSGPPEAISELVTVEAVEGEGGAGWTRITVRGQIEEQE